MQQHYLTPTKKIFPIKFTPGKNNSGYYVYTNNWEGFIPRRVIRDEGNSWLEINKKYAEEKGIF